MTEHNANDNTRSQTSYIVRTRQQQQQTTGTLSDQHIDTVWKMIERGGHLALRHTAAAAAAVAATAVATVGVLIVTA